METFKAIVTQVGEKHFIKIEAGKTQISIPMSEDKPNEVKSAFNKLITQLKDGKFQIELANGGDDLFYLVAKEYITQLNKEILEVYGEMKEYSLVAD